MKKILIIGATSAIAKSCARLWAKEQSELCLIGRDTEKLMDISSDLKTRGASKVTINSLDVLQFDSHQSVIDEAFNEHKSFDIVLIAHGSLPNQAQCEKDTKLTIQEINTNGTSVISLLTIIAKKVEHQQYGNIAVISSVAADRGRASNCVYGAAKAMVSTFLSGLRQRLAKANVFVLDIRPGFVDTPMTAEFKKGALWATPDAVAVSIVAAIDRRKSVVYTPGFWRVIMYVIKTIPTRLFNKLKF